MAIPVLVVHGVANRDRGAFERRVRLLNTGVGEAWSFIPVFWGDLGAAIEGLDATLPPRTWGEVRGSPDAGADDPVFRDLFASGALASATSIPDEVRSDVTKQELVARSAGDAVDPAPAAHMVRSTSQAQEVETAVRDVWNESVNIRKISDPGILREIGRAIGDGVQAAAVDSQAIETRGVGGDIRALTRAVFNAVDKSLGQVIGRAGGFINDQLRRSIIPGLTQFLGDVVVYHHRVQEIRQRIYDAVEAHAPGFGTKDRPIHVVAHSLGGIVALDAAVSPIADRRLWIDRFITFGSQPAYFHVVEPRGAEVAPYVLGRPPVRLPPSIRRWVNIWEPMDLVAFVTSRVFEMSDGSKPKDVELSHRTGSGLWTHSAYWEHPDAIAEIRQALR